jgi:hypothetical protein
LCKNDTNYKNAIAYDKANDFLVDERQHGGLDVIAQVNIIREEFNNGYVGMIDYLDGVQVVEQFEFTFTTQDFLKEIGLID